MTAIGLVFCFIYTLAGISGFVAFLVLGNYSGSVWAFATGAIAAIATQLRYLKFRNRLDTWYSERELSPLSFVGFVCFTIGIMGVAYHTAIEVLLKKPILPINQSEIIPIVWAFMTAKCSVLLMCTVREYRNLNEDEERSDLVQSYNETVQEENGDISTVTE
ncbi:hypothetical protein ILUMI_12477 [Ignelater luminosus]|uniref:Uncharacterized protein n=1 Tax=Ignelater luminosus TaxID=2038154 RepID=A0A8K0CWE1_IGNLU|nr:hypothetical protein ILUMI_12477 [Ignelater luminosus]